jgi:hypothetical protein
MRYILILLCFLLPATATALTGDATRFDFTQGAPATTDDTTTTCNNQATARYDFTAGVPAPMLDTTATCTAAAPSTNIGDPIIIIFE